MNRRYQNIRAALALSSVMLAGLAQAKTIALWPIEYDEGQMKWNPFCQVNAVDGSYPLLAYSVKASADANPLGWELPQNPDPSVPLERVRNSTAPYGLAGDGNAPMLVCERIASDYLTRQQDYTVETYVKLLDLPTAGGWYFLFGGLNKDSSSISQDNNNRWMVTLRHDAKNANYYWNFYSAGGNVGDKKVKALTVDEAAALTNVWHHLAFTHKAKNASSQEVWQLFLDGEQIGSDVSTTPLASIVTPVAHNLDIGGRFGQNRASAAYDYVRVSDAVLAPSEFLCAANPNVPTPAATLAYWKFDVGADGKPDLRPSVGEAEFSGLCGIGDKTNMPTSLMIPCRRDQAPTGIAGNAGCVWGRATKYSYLSHPNVGTELTMLNSFTAEGWFKPSQGDYAADATRVLFSTRDTSNIGWTLFFTKNVKFGTSNAWGFYLSLNNDAKTEDVYFTGAPDLVAWNDWKHVALVYDATEGNGTWRLYLDGILHGTVANTEAPSYAKSHVWPFLIGGRHTGTMYWGGGIDYVRISKAVLQPAQFLNAADGGASATDVLATWPLDVRDEIFFEGKDVSGNERHLDRNWQDKNPNTSAKYIPTARDDAPVITNPDRSFAFRGDPSAKSGSVQFWDAVNKNTIPGRCSYVATRERSIIDAMTARQPLTVEMFVKRTCDASACEEKQWEHLCAWYGAIDMSGKGGSTVLLRYDSAKGFQVADEIWMNESATVPFNDKGAAEPKNEWRHYAFVRTFEDSDLVWTLYINGTWEGEVRRTARTTPNSSGTDMSTFVAGGRGSDVTAFKGRFGTMRISTAALTPADFLCAAKQSVPGATEPELIASWPLDVAGGVIDAANKAASVIGGYDLVLSNATARAEGRKGSVKLSDGGAVAPYLGLYATMFRPFTVEGWVKNPSGPLCGTWDDTTLGGWQLTANGDGTFGLKGRSNFRGTYYLSGTFDARAFARTDWHHVALRYDPLAGAEGTWTLFVNKKVVGTVANLSRPQDYALTVPRNLAIAGGYDGVYDGLGTASQKLTVPFSGSIDRWRFTRRALAADELDYTSGLLLMLK